MKKESINKVKLGIFVSIGIILFITGIYFIGQTKKLFSSTFRVSALFKDVNGLQVGNNIRFAGINVGSVDGIEIITDTTVKVDMVIDVKTKKFIRKDSKAIIGTDGLMGNKIMNISPGTNKTAEIENYDYIGTTIPISVDEMLLKLKTTVDNATKITTDLAAISGNISSGSGTIGKLFMDKEFANNLDGILVNVREGTENYKKTFNAEFANNLNSILLNVKDGTEGFKKTMDAAKDSWLLGSFWGGKSDDKNEDKLKEEQKVKDEELLKEKKNDEPKTQKEIDAELKKQRKADLDEKIEALKRNKAKELKTKKK